MTFLQVFLYLLSKKMTELVTKNVNYSLRLIDTLILARLLKIPFVPDFPIWVRVFIAWKKKMIKNVSSLGHYHLDDGHR